MLSMSALNIWKNGVGASFAGSERCQKIAAIVERLGKGNKEQARGGTRPLDKSDPS
jgi:hypothetical protein